MAASILGLDHELPPLRSVGGVERALLAAPAGASDLAMACVERAFAEAGWTAPSVEMIVFATMTPDVTFPGAGCFLQEKLGGETVGALDVRSQCAGFLTGLAVANDLVEAGKYERVLLAAAEVHSSALDYSDDGLEIARLYGDGGAVAAIGRGDGVASLESVVCGTDGQHYDRFWCEFPASARYPTRMTLDDFRAGGHYLRIDRDHVAAFGREKLPQIAGEALQAAVADGESVDLFVLSHVFPEVAEDAARALGATADRSLVAGAEHGHLTAASLPLALDQARKAGRVGSGARVCLAACGAGYAWGAAVVKVH